MPNPLADLTKLAHAPSVIARDLASIAQTLRSLPVIEDVLNDVSSALTTLVPDVERIRKTVEPQQKRVAHIEQMMQALGRRTITIEQAVLALQDKVDAAIKLLPDPDDDRGPLVKAKDVITGG